MRKGEWPCLSAPRKATRLPPTASAPWSRNFSSGGHSLYLPLSFGHLQRASFGGRFSCGDGQMHRERAALARPARDRDAAAVGFDDAADDAEAEAVAVNLLLLRPLAAIERLEHVRQGGPGGTEGGGPGPPPQSAPRGPRGYVLRARSRGSTARARRTSRHCPPGFAALSAARPA